MLFVWRRVGRSRANELWRRSAPCDGRVIFRQPATIRDVLRGHLTRAERAAEKTRRFGCFGASVSWRLPQLTQVHKNVRWAATKRGMRGERARNSKISGRNCRDSNFFNHTSDALTRLCAPHAHAACAAALEDPCRSEWRLPSSGASACGRELE